LKLNKREFSEKCCRFFSKLKKKKNKFFYGKEQNFGFFFLVTEIGSENIENPSWKKGNIYIYFKETLVERSKP